MTQASLSASGIDAQPAVELGYDAAGRLASLNRSDLYGGGSGGRGGTTVDTDFTYDAAGQLVGEISTDGTLDFTYDVMGQLTGVSGWRTESSGYALVGS